MKITVAILLLISATASSIEWTDLRVTQKSPSLDPCHLSSYYQMPRTKADAISDGWVEVFGVTSLNLSAYCLEGDARICLEYDTHGNIAAIQVAIPYNDDDADLQISMNLFQIKRIFNRKHWTSTVYFISPATIAAGGRCNMNGLTGTDGIWIGMKDGYMKIPRNVSYLDSPWTKQNCVPTMGRHYMYGNRNPSECKAIQPWNLLAQDGELSGVRLLGLGKATSRTRHYYETVDLAGINAVLSTNKQCFIDWVNQYGIIAIHVYFTSEPWEIQC